MAADDEDELVRQRPQDADERDQQYARLQQPDREARRQIGQLARVFLDTLVGIDAELTGEPEPVGAPARQPVIEQVPRQPFA